MQTPYNCTYVIPYYHTPSNLKTLQTSLNNILQDPRIQVVVVEAGDHPRVNNIDLRSEYVFVETKLWNIGWLFNIGARKAKTDKLFFGDFRFTPRMDVIQGVLNDTSNRHCIYMQDRIIRMTKEETEQRNFDITKPSEQKIHEGIFYYTREGYIACGGFDENTIGSDFYEVQNRRNTSSLNMGHVNGVTLFQQEAEMMELGGEDIENSSKFLTRIESFDKNQMISYLKAQSVKNGYKYKYRKIPLMIQ